MKKWKYLAIFSLPCCVCIALFSHGWLCYLPLLVYFGILPLFELFLSPDRQNLTQDELEMVRADGTYDLLLFLTVPAQVITLSIFLVQMQEVGLSTSDTIGRILAMGLSCGVMGINVGHELGHRNGAFPKFLGEVMMLTSLQNHFIPYHNHGHHRYVATPKDPATARRNEPVYSFWFRSQIGSYFEAWKISNGIAQKKGGAAFSFKNVMLRYSFAQIGLCILIYWTFSFQTLLYFICAATFGILLLETVNYIEHYGLQRAQRPNGGYEPVRPRHSWNSDHLIGRAVLFELSRHSDHHYKASKHYQLLETVPESPQMPTGYPGMMLFALLSPLWFAFMNRRIDGFSAGD
jgi:alkane 1-monooxygenase